jgi:hypothetical protein
LAGRFKCFAALCIQSNQDILEVFKLIHFEGPLT